MDIKQTILLSRKLDIYGVMLTQKQKDIMNSYLNYNGSISEIAENFGTTRQAVLDIIKRTTQKLDEFENKLGLCQKLDKIYLRLSKIFHECGLTKQTQDIIMKEVKTLED